MRVKSIHLTKFKRFTDLIISDIPESARLVMLTGPNGSGKTAVFESFNWWRRNSGGWGPPRDDQYFPKILSEDNSRSLGVVITFHGTQPKDRDAQRRAFWIRSAYRHDPDFTSTQLTRQQSPLDDPGLERLVSSEQAVKKNYERLGSLGVMALFDPGNANRRVGDLQEEFVGPLRAAMDFVFGDLQLLDVGNPIEDGTFFFRKGTSHRFHFKNLSAGERAAFDILLDITIKTKTYNDTVFCIDEPELHLGTRVQGRLLRALVDHIPKDCQLWLATHSTGFMKEAMAIYKERPDEVVFLDTAEQDFDAPAHIRPHIPNRSFMQRHLQVALDDIAALVAPETLVICEGEGASDGFDAACYSRIFADHVPDVQFLSLGNSREVKHDKHGVASAVRLIVPGTKIIKVVDRDDHTQDEIVTARASGVSVLGRRNIEGYLLADDILRKLCEAKGRPDLGATCIAHRDKAISAAATGQGKAPDDYKQAAQAVRVFAKEQLLMTQSGSTTNEFLRSVVAPLVTPDTATYDALRRDIFGPSSAPAPV